MKALRIVKSLVLLFLGFLLLLVNYQSGPVNASGGLGIQGTERRITNNPYDQDSPAISGNIVSYTDYRGVDFDVWYYDLSIGTERMVPAISGYQELSDVSDGIIVYASYPSRDAYGGDVYAYFTLTNQTVNVSQNRQASSPAIDKGLVVWEDYRYTIPEIYAMNLATNETRQISYSGGNDIQPNVNNGGIVWQRNLAIRMLNPYHIFYYDWISGITQQITSTGINDIGQRYPHIDGKNIVYQNGSAFGGDICLYNLTSSTETKWSQPSNALYSHPVISREFASFNNYNITSQISHIMLLHLPTGSLFMVNVNSTSDQWLGDIDGNRIVYADDRNGQLDIYMYEFTLQALPGQSVGGISGITNETISTLTQYTVLIVAMIGIMTAPRVILKRALQERRSTR